MQFAKNTQRDTSKVLLPHKMTMEFSKMLRMKRKNAIRSSTGKRRKSIAPVTQNDLL